MGAALVLLGKAVLTLAAGSEGVNTHSHPWLRPRDGRANLENLATKLVAQNEGRYPTLIPAEKPALIGATNPCGPNTKENLVCPHFRNRELTDLQLPGAKVNKSLHETPSLDID